MYSLREEEKLYFSEKCKFGLIFPTSVTVSDIPLTYWKVHTFEFIFAFNLIFSLFCCL